MSRRHEEEKVGDWRTAVAAFTGFAAFLSLFLLPEVFPLHTRRLWVDITNGALAILLWVFDTFPMGWIIVLGAFTLTALLGLGAAFISYQKARAAIRKRR